MKSLELQLNKRLLIVEYPSIDFAEGIEKLSEFSKKYKLICKGSELTEDIAKGFLLKNMRIAHNGEYLSPIEEFKFHVRNHGYHWGENPLGTYEDNIIHGDASEFFKNWQDAESRTFNPEKCIIFEIL